MRAAQRYLTESAAVNVSPKYTALNAFWQGEIAFAQGDYPVAAAKYNAYLKRAPRTEREYALAWYNLGYCAFDRNDLGQAQASFRKFLAAWSPTPTTGWATRPIPTAVSSRPWGSMTKPSPWRRPNSSTPATNGP